MRGSWTPGALLACILALPAATQAQDVQERLGTYKIINAYEFGYRSVFAAGNREMYRSTINYNNGFRLFEGLLRVNSGDGHGRFFDEIVLTTMGSGGDPYQANSLRLEKNRLFRLDMGFRIVNYYNQLLSLSGGEHRFNTERIFQNYDLILLPRSKVQFLVGFDRNNQNGPALTSENFDARGDPAFPRDRFFVFADSVRRVNNQWRAGANVTAAGIKLSFLQGWDFYKEDTLHSLDPATINAGLINSSPLLPGNLRRYDPVHGLTPFSRLNLHTDANRRLAVNGRLVYAGGDRNYVLDENISNLGLGSDVPVTRQTYVLGRARRTQGTGDLTLSYQPGERWALANTTSINQTRITGDSAFIELRTPVSAIDPGRNEYFFDVLGIRLITNSSDVNFRPAKQVGFHGGYHFSTRRIQSREILADISGAPSGVPLNTFQNVTHSGLGGVRVKPWPNFTALFDAEYGRADRPFTPISERRFHAETLKAQWKSKAWLISGSFKAYHNLNAPPVIADLGGGSSSAHSYQSRQYSATVAWAPARRYSFDASYARLHLDTVSGILDFPLPDLAPVAARHTLYVSNLHHGYATFRLDLLKNAVLFLGYSIVKDTADGSSRPDLAAPFAAAYPNFRFDGTDLINTYPLSYQSPQARLAWKLHRKLSWNAGWQFYNYHEKFSGVQNYHAHVSHTSLRWSF